MGMYDEVSNSLAERIVRKCPNCKKDLYDCEEPAVWQTKSFDRILKTLDLEDIDCDTFEMHTICPHCGDYMSANVTLADGDYNIRTNAYNIDYKEFEDSNLVTDYNKVRIDRVTNKYTRHWLEHYNIGYTYSEESSKEELLKILDDIKNNHYVVPKFIVE